MDTPPFWNSTVNVESSIREIRGLLQRHDVSAFRFSEDYQDGGARIEFVYKNILVRFEVSGDQVAKTVLKHNPWNRHRRKSENEYLKEIQKKSGRVAMRLIVEQLKASLDAVYYGASRFEDVFLSHFVKKDDQTVGEWIQKEMAAGKVRMLGPGEQPARTQE